MNIISTQIDRLCKCEGSLNARNMFHLYLFRARTRACVFMCMCVRVWKGRNREVKKIVLNAEIS